MKKYLKSDFGALCIRIAILYGMYYIGQILFLLYNNSIIQEIEAGEILDLIKGSFVFNSVSIFYINVPFIIASLLPFGYKNRKKYQFYITLWFVITNTLCLLLHFSDIFYYEYKLGRISSDDIHFFTEANNLSLLWAFIVDFWYGFIAFILLIWGFYKLVSKVPYPQTITKSSKFYISQSILLLASIIFAIFMIRGGSFSSSTMPISMNDATLYTKKPTHSSVILSNPFCLIRTLNNKVSYIEYFKDKDSLNSYFSPIIKFDSTATRPFSIDKNTNIVFIILESFGASHLQKLNPLQKKSYTPFLDSIMDNGYLFTKAFHNGIRSMDALPSIWASIPSFREHFLSLPQSMAPIKPITKVLADKGYSTAFLHGAIESSMGFVAFGNRSGVSNFFTREDYEAEKGTEDFDGKWGIWDQKFFPFAEEKISTLQEPFCATIFSLSSHHPFLLPEGLEEKYKGGAIGIYKTLEYTDDALKAFFINASKEEWYNKTLFVITADHGSGEEHAELSVVPHSYAVPIIFYKPNSNIKGINNNVMGHIDITPTLLGLLQYKEDFFGFGTDVFALKKPKEHITVNYSGGFFNFIGENNTTLFDEKNITNTYPTKFEMDSTEFDVNYAKAFLQQYYLSIKDKKYVVDQNK